VFGCEQQRIDIDAVLDGVPHRRSHGVDVSETLREDVHGLLGLAKETTRLAFARFADVDDVEQVFGRAEIVDASVSNWCVRVHERLFDCFDVLAKSLVGVPPVRDGALCDPDGSCG